MHSPGQSPTHRPASSPKRRRRWSTCTRLRHSALILLKVGIVIFAWAQTLRIAHRLDLQSSRLSLSPSSPGSSNTAIGTHDGRMRDVFLRPPRIPTPKMSGRRRRRGGRSDRGRSGGGGAAPRQYEVGPACLGVAVEGTSFRCTDRMERYLADQSRNNLTRAEVAGIVAGEYPASCGRCAGPGRTDADGNGMYWRFDAAAPRIVENSGVSHFLASIPAEARIPTLQTKTETEGGDDEGFNRLLTAHLAQRWADANNDTDFYFEYNPSLVALPRAVAHSLNLPPHEAEAATYLMSLRVTPANGCFPNEVYGSMSSEQWMATRSVIKRNYVALALLRSDLTVLPGREVVIDDFVQTEAYDSSGEQIWSPWFSQAITDYRIFATGDGALYFNINGLPVHVAPFRLIPDDDGSTAGTKAAHGLPEEGRILCNLYGGGFRVALLQNLTAVWEGGLNGKNYAVFQTDEVRADEALFELNVGLPVHKVQRMRLDDFHTLKLSESRALQWPRKDWTWVDSPKYEKENERRVDRTRRRRNVAVGDPSVSKGAPGRSFATVDELWFRGRNVFKRMAHGGACCVAIGMDHFRAFAAEAEEAGGSAKIASEGSHLLAGIGHTKIPFKEWYRREDVREEEKRKLPHGHYVSFFYAFEPRAPYEMRAVSGYFCLGYGTEEEERVNPYYGMARKEKLSLNDEEFDCPKIHFVSGVTEKAGDDSRLIVSYGVNDCVPRMVEIEKSEVARLLVAGPAPDL